MYIRPIRSDEQQSSGNDQDASTKGGHDRRRRGRHRLPGDRIRNTRDDRTVREERRQGG